MEIDEFPHLKAWEERMVKRPGVEKGRNVPSPQKFNREMMKNKEEVDKYAKQSSAWIMEGQQEDAKKG